MGARPRAARGHAGGALDHPHLPEDRVDDARRRLPILALFAAQFFSLGGNAIALVAIPIIALTQTGSPLAAGVAGVFATVPLIIGGTFGGVLVDRFGYRVSSIVADVASGLTVIAIPLLSATVGLPFGVLLALVFLGGLLDPPGDTAKTVARARPREARADAARPRRGSAVRGAAHLHMVGCGRRRRARRAVRPGAGAHRGRGGFVVSAVLVACFVPRAVSAAADAMPRAATSTRRAGSSRASASSRRTRCCGRSCCS